MIIRTGVPIHTQVKDDIYLKIKNGFYKPGEKLPSERILSEQYNVSRVTIRQSILQLVSEGVIYKKNRLGNFVKSSQISQTIGPLIGIVEELSNQNISTTISKVDIRKIRYDEENKIIWDKLNQDYRQELYVIKRVLSADNTPLLLDYNYLPFEIGEKLINFDFKKDVLFNALDTLGYNISNAVQRISAVTSRDTESDELQISLNSPLLKVDRTSFDIYNIPILYTTAYFVGDSYSYELCLNRKNK